MRVRIRRFGGLSDQRTVNLGIPSESKYALGSAIWSPGESANRHGPCPLPAVFAAKSRFTPRLRSSANRVVPRFHCFQIADRSLRRSHFSRSSNTEGV